MSDIINSREKVVVVDDDIVTRYLIGSELRNHGFDTYECDSAEALFTLLEQQRVDVIILDLVLPNVNGLDALTFLREGSDVGIIMISSRANTAHRLDGLKEGADDFLKKPVNTKELIFKIRSLAARVRKQQGHVPKQNLVIGNCEICSNDNLLKNTNSNRVCRLTGSEQRMLILLSQNINQTCNRKQLNHSIIRPEVSESNMRSIDTLISRIRKKLKDLSSDLEIISVRGQGYRLTSKN